MLDRIRAIRDRLSHRRQAYARVFNTEDDPLGDRRAVLDDLAKFCRFGDTVFHPNQRVTDVLIGRQEVLQRILDHAHLDLETLYVKQQGERFNPRKESNSG